MKSNNKDHEWLLIKIEDSINQHFDEMDHKLDRLDQKVDKCFEKVNHHIEKCHHRTIRWIVGMWIIITYKTNKGLAYVSPFYFSRLTHD